MKTILLGGLEPGLADLVVQALAPFPGDYEFQHVGSLGELLVLLETAQGDLLFLDMDTPKGVAMEWLARLAEVTTTIPILAVGDAERPDITGYELRFPDHYFPFLTYLRKPLTAEGVVKAVQAEFRHVARGVIEGLSLASLLQMLHLEGKTCTIRVTSGRRQGFFYLRTGQIINARYRRLEGTEAALQLLCSADPKAEIDGQLHDTTHLIHARIEELMMEAMRLQDEATRDHAAALEDEGPEVLPASETGKWEVRPQARPAAPPPRKRRRLLWVAAVVLLPVSAVPLFLPREETVEIRSSPQGATVLLDGLARGRTPLGLSLPKPLRGSVQVELAGFEPQSATLSPGGDHLDFTLKAVPPPAPPPAVAAPAPEPEPAPEPAPAVKTRHPAVAKAAPKPAAKARKGDVFDQLRQP